MTNSDFADLSQEEMTRYSRHIILPNVGLEGQKRLKSAKVLIIGSGALGSPVALYLAAAGVGTIGVVDFDEVDVTNLQRQIMHKVKTVGKLKTQSAKEAILDLNPLINVITFNTKLDSKNALEIIKDFDVVADCTDNFPTRYLINDACVLLGKPLAYGSIFRFEGQASLFWAKKGACYRCLFPSPPPPGLVPGCGEGGVFGVLPGIIGSIQANEIIKFIIGAEELLINKLLLCDAWRMRFTQINMQKDENCPICGKNPSIAKLIDYEFFCGLKKEDEKKDMIEHISVRDLKRKIDNNEAIKILDVREPFEFEIARIENSLNIPLNQVVIRAGEIDKTAPVAVICKSGVRSIYAIQMLRQKGFSGKLLNVKGGILAWADEIDKSLTKY